MVVSPEQKIQVAPGPKGLPVLGSALGLIFDILGTSLNGMLEYGDVVRYVAGPPGPMRVIAYGIAHPDGVQHVLARADHYSKQDATYNELRALVGDGLLTSEGEVWRRQKRLVQPLFTHQRVAKFASLMAEEGEALVRRWEELGSKDGSVDLHSEMTRLSLKIVSRALFGEEAESFIPVLKDNVPFLSRRAFARSLAPIKIPAEWPTPGNRHADRAIGEIEEMVDSIIARRRENPTGSDDLISLLLEAQDPEGGLGLSDDEVRDQALIFLLAGHETTATSLSFTLHLLGNHPEIQDKVQAEVDAVLGDRQPVLEDSKELKYTTMAIKEAMRLYPAAYAIPRMTEVDDEISGYAIPKGSVAVVSPWVTHRHPAFWDDPETFDPERFTPEKEKARHRYAYFPFGGGPRACIGQYFSMLEAIIVTSQIAKAFRLETSSEPVPLFTGITLRPKKAMPCKIEARTAKQ